MSDIFQNAQIAGYNDRLQIFGLGSQWDTKTILEAELNLLHLRQQPYYTQKKNYESEKSIWTQLKTALTNFNNIVQQVKDLTYNSKSVTMSEEGYITATATGDALDASYTVSVQQLATKHRVMSDQQAEGALGISETVQLNGKDLTITADMDLKAIAKAINDGSYGVSAVVLNNRLVLTSKESGPSNAIQFSNSAAWETLGLTQDGIIKNELQEAKSAIFTINGIQMTSESNTFSGIDGLTINFTKETTSDIEITVQRSAEQVIEKVKLLVDEYNKVIDTINKLSGEKGALQGESIPRNVKRQMNELLFSVNDVGTKLYELGITLDKNAKNGRITLNESDLRKMYESDPNKVMNLISGQNGFAGKLYSVIDNYVKADGSIQSEIDGLDNRIKRIDQTLERYEQQFEKQKESMIRKYAIFETMMSSLTMQNNFLQAQLASWNNNNN